MILLIDNYDSFSYNLYQLIGMVNDNQSVKVIRNDELTVDEITELKPDAIVLSPGPGRPENAGVCIEVINSLKGKVPILGVCLGHQAICMAYGAKITYASELFHGKQRIIKREEDSLIFAGMPMEFLAARYHSLAADELTIPGELFVSARSEEGEVMAVEDKKNMVFGLQFHPESIMTPDGETIMKNFFNQTQGGNRQ